MKAIKSLSLLSLVILTSVCNRLPTPTEACVEAAGLRCERLTSCGMLSKGEDEATCKVGATHACVSGLVCPSGVPFQPARVDACLAQLRSASCEAVADPASIAACQQVCGGPLYSDVLATLDIEVGGVEQLHTLGRGRQRVEITAPAAALAVPRPVKVSLVGGTAMRGRAPATSTAVLIEPQALIFIAPVRVRQLVPPAPAGRRYRMVVVPDNANAFVQRGRARVIQPASDANDGWEIWEGDAEGSGLWGFALEEQGGGCARAAARFQECGTLNAEEQNGAFELSCRDTLQGLPADCPSHFDAFLDECIVPASCASLRSSGGLDTPAQSEGCQRALQTLDTECESSDLGPDSGLEPRPDSGVPPGDSGSKRDAAAPDAGSTSSGAATPGDALAP
ncbi:MAG: hypothetical protein KA712_00610 [Myxococcales bacterium]|nr:hypothetical protein [Myxococcales bacterium]